MLKTNIKTIGAVVAILAIGIALFWFSSKDNQDQQGTQSIQENLQASVESNRMQASRTKRGVYIIDRVNFEKDVKNGLASTKGAGLTNLEDKDVKFAYLIDSSAKDLNDKMTDNKGVKISADLTDEKSKYVAVKGVRVLVDANGDGDFTSNKDVIGTLALDVRSDTKDGEK